MDTIKIGDKVRFSDKVLSEFPQESMEFLSTMVYQVVNIQGDKLRLHCGTTLFTHEAAKVDPKTPLRT